MMCWGIHSSSEAVSTWSGRLASRTSRLGLDWGSCRHCKATGLLHRDGRIGGRVCSSSGRKSQASKIEVCFGMPTKNRCPCWQGDCVPDCVNRTSCGIFCSLPRVDSSHLDDLHQVPVRELGGLLHQATVDTTLLQSEQHESGTNTLRVCCLQWNCSQSCLAFLRRFLSSFFRIWRASRISERTP